MSGNKSFHLVLMAVFVLTLPLLSCIEETPRVVDSVPCDPAASAHTVRVLEYIAGFSGGDATAVISGQNCGHGSQIADPDDMMGYAAILGDLLADTGKLPGIIGVDYEHDRIFTPEQLSDCNAVLIDYWNAGGLVTINWAPHNPWLNDESDIAGNPGTWTDTRNQGNNMENVDLNDLVDPASAIYPVWRTKLDRIADALLELQMAGVVVLWRPLQEMNGFWFWWGTTTSPSNGEPYRAVYRDMYDYFTNVKGLHNLLWVYSPCNYANNPAPGIVGPNQCYPGDSFVDIVAGTVYNDNLTIADYRSYLAFDKPLGMAEYGADSGGSHALNGTFDNRRYAETLLSRYPGMAYWVSWHNWDNGNGTSTWQSLNANAHAAECMGSKSVITRDEIILP
jgi:mannan endo-1,4-beta-mannosidase